VWSRLAQVVEDIVGRATRVEQRIGQHGEADAVQMAAGQQTLGQARQALEQAEYELVECGPLG
jgi:hypothetical protein